MSLRNSETVVVLDFETSGISPNHGDRAIEVGAVVLCRGEIIDRFQSLMNPGIRISGFIEAYTGITNSMVQNAPESAEVMQAFGRFIADRPLVAHNAAFDCRFLDAEFRRIRQQRRQLFGCSMLAARRVYPEAPNHKLGTLVRYKNLHTDGIFHRALADAEMTAHLWNRMSDDLKTQYGLKEVSFDLLRGLTQVPRSRVDNYLGGRRDNKL